MTTSDNQGERNTFALNAESTAGMAPRTSRNMRNVVAFVAGLTLGFLPLILFLLNHLTISSPLFPLNPRLTFCNIQTHMPDAKIGMLDTVVFNLYLIEACLGLPTVVVMGMVFHWRKSTIALCASGLLLAVVFIFFFYFYFLFPISWRQCFHLVGEHVFPTFRRLHL